MTGGAFGGGRFVRRGEISISAGSNIAAVAVEDILLRATDEPSGSSRSVDHYSFAGGEDSWLEYLRVLERATRADIGLRDAVKRFQQGDAPRASRFLA